MKTNRNIKPFHNGKNRRTGRPSDPRRTSNRSATANTPDADADAVRLAWVAAKLKQRAIKAERSDSGNCCSTEAAKKATNERLLKILHTTLCVRVWNGLLGRWEGVLPRRFVREHAVHMAHFRDFARDNGYRSR